MIISKGKAVVSFLTLWDSAAHLVPNNYPCKMKKELEKEIDEYFSSELGYSEGSPIGAIMEKEVKTQTFEDLLKAIDEIESELLDQEQNNSKNLHEWLNQSIQRMGEHDEV